MLFQVLIIILSLSLGLVLCHLAMQGTPSPPPPFTSAWLFQNVLFLGQRLPLSSSADEWTWWWPGTRFSFLLSISHGIRTCTSFYFPPPFYHPLLYLVLPCFSPGFLNAVLPTASEPLVLVESAILRLLLRSKEASSLDENQQVQCNQYPKMLWALMSVTHFLVSQFSSFELHS